MLHLHTLGDAIDAGSVDSKGVRVAEVVATLSLATDLGMGQPDQYAIRSTIVAMRLGEALGLTDDELVDTYYLALLRYAGCTADTPIAADVFGDERAFRRDFATVDFLNPTAIMAAMVTKLGADKPLPERLAILVHALAGMPRLMGTAQSHCEVGQRLAERMGLGERLRRGLSQVFERWDGKGTPNGVRGEAIELPMRVVALAHDAVTFHRYGGVDAVVGVTRQRSGHAYDPRIADRFCRDAPSLLASAETASVWDAVLDAEPGPRPTLNGEQLDNALHAMADFADLKSAYTVGHSSGVARLVAEAAKLCRLPRSEAEQLRRAAFVHDLGRVGVTSAIWEKPSALTEEEWEQVRLHPYFAERVLRRSAVLAPLGVLASTHHERLDGSGYHRGVPAASLSLAARILAAADVYQALTQRRPYRPARSPDEAADELRREVKLGRLDPEAANAVLSAAGHQAGRRRAWPAGLTEREIEVLRLLARGYSNREVARALTISEKTAGHHVQHIYDKIGVSTRPAAMLFAMQHDLLQERGE
jgi:HD-GYP domain-containing protein (c-di-GMP phosphodiesterase class II)